MSIARTTSISGPLQILMEYHMDLYLYFFPNSLSKKHDHLTMLSVIHYKMSKIQVLKFFAMDFGLGLIQVENKCFFSIFKKVGDLTFAMTLKKLLMTLVQTQHRL